jgi:P4 family phage/plasmid primase-like protien
MDMEKVLEPFEALLRSSVGRIDDPGVVIDLVLRLLYDEYRYYESWGTYQWDGRHWKKKFDKRPDQFSNKEVVELVEPYIIDIIDELSRFLYAPRPDVAFWMETDAAIEKLRTLLSDKNRLSNIAWGVIYGGWYIGSDVSDICLVRQHSDLLETKDFLSVDNGVIDLKTGALYRHDDKKELFFTHVLQTPYNPNASADSFCEALEIVTNGNVHLAEYLQWALGSAITGHKTYSNVFWLYGPPQTRKELFLQIVADILEDYSIIVPHTAFMHANGNKSLIKKLNGKRMLYCLDYPNGAHMQIGSLKTLCEADDMLLYWHEKEHYVCSLTNVFVASSGFPKVLIDPSPFWTRVRPIVLPTPRRYHNLFDDAFIRKVMQEKEGILAWLVKGAKKYLADPSLQKGTLSFSDLANDMKERWVKEMKSALSEREQNKKPLPTRKGQTHNKNRL